MADVYLQRQALRLAGLQARRQQSEPQETSLRLLDRMVGLPEYQQASVVLWYVSARYEVRTHVHLKRELASNKSIVIPYCEGNELRLFALQEWSELEQGAYRILEPSPRLRGMPNRQVTVKSVDFVVAPGVAFDPFGNRLGHGQGYYDRLLSQCPQSTVRCGICFQSQVGPQVPHEPQDVPMHLVVTESNVYDCRK